MPRTERKWYKASLGRIGLNNENAIRESNQRINKYSVFGHF